MAEVKNNFLKSRMNQDLDDRLVPNGEYRYANNISAGKTQSDDIGVLENILGNTPLQFTTNLPLEEGLECIGAFMDNQNNRIFQFLTDYEDPLPNNITYPTDGNMRITVYDFNSPETYTVLVEGLFLNFAKNTQFRITGVNLIEGLLFWTDNRNQPRKINVSNALIDPNYYTKEDQISVAKYAPVDPISLYKKESATVVSGSGTTYILSNIDSLACTIGTVSGTLPNPYTATITTAVVDGFAGFSVGDVIAGTNGSGSFGLGQLVITSLISSTSVEVSSTAIFSAGTVSITLKYPSLGGLQSGATVLSVSPTGVQGLTGSDYAIVVSMSNTTLTLYQLTTTINNNDILTFLISTMTDKSDVPSWPGDPAFLEDKYVRFSYRFKYDDNEYSLMAPFTQIAYIPKQKGYFIDGNEIDAYRSTIINWFENNVNNIELVVPLPDKIGNLTNSYKIKEIDILYKESDSLAIKVFETLPISVINTGVNTDNNYYVQPYQSQKPYKTLSEDQTVRVYDKVPVRARAQESAGNRIIYGNYYDKYTCVPSINYNISIQPKLAKGTNFIEYPNHTLKKNRNYQVGFIIADKFGRQSPVILSSVDLIGLDLGGNTYAKGSTIYSSYENSVLFEDVRTWFGDSLILYLNAPIDQQKDIPSGRPGLYAIPTSDSGFSITASTITDTTYTYTLDITADINTQPVIGNILRGFYTDYVTVLSNPTPTGVANEYIITTSGRVNGIYEHVSLPGGVTDIKFSYEYNPIGWYSYKIVVKQQEQDYYNVYLPGMLNGYPLNQTYGSQVVYSTSGSTTTPTLQNGINVTQFPVSETGNTSHIVLINDNINKVPRDLTEVGPDQKQYRSSVQLYGRVENIEDTIELIGEDPLYSAKVTTITYDTAASGQDPNWELIKSGDGIQCVQANEPIPNPDPSLGGTIPNPYRWLKDTVVVSNEVVGTTGTIELSSPNWVLKAGSGSTVDYVDFIITRAENRQYFPTRKADTVISIATANEFNFLDNSVDNLSGTAALNFYQLQSSPLIGRVSTVNKIGVIGEDMIPFLSVYETRPEVSILELFWETTTTGLISDLNADILTGFDGPSSFGNFNYIHFEEQDPAGDGEDTGAADSRYVTDPFVVLNQNGVILPNTQVTLSSVFDGNGNNRTGEFTVETIVGGTEISYRLKINNRFIFTNDAPSLESYIFTFNVVDLSPNGTTTTLSASGRLGNNKPIITTSEQNYTITQNTTNIVTLEANNGAFYNNPTIPASILGLKWSIISGNTPVYFEIGELSGQLELIEDQIPLGEYELVIKVQDAVNTTTGDILPIEGETFATQYETINLNISVGDEPVPYWLRPPYESLTSINGGSSCGNPGVFIIKTYGMVYIGPEQDFGSEFTYLPEIPTSGRDYQIAENIEITNFFRYGNPSEQLLPTGLTEGEYRIKVKMRVPGPELCNTGPSGPGIAQVDAYFKIYLYKRLYTPGALNVWSLTDTANNKPTPYQLPTLQVSSVIDGDDTLLGQEKILTTSFTIEADPNPDNFYEWAVGVELINDTPLNTSDTSDNQPTITFFGEDANFSYDMEGSSELPPIVNDYVYYTNIITVDPIDYTSAMPRQDQDATVGLEYDENNSIVEGIINDGDLLIDVTLGTVNNQVTPGLITVFRPSPNGIPLEQGQIVYVDPINPAIIKVQLYGPYSGSSINLVGKTANFIVTEGIGTAFGPLYANTIEGTEIKRFYTDPGLTQKWIPPFANRFYVFKTAKDYNPNDATLDPPPIPPPLRYTKFPYYCAKFNEDGEMVNQISPIPDSQTAWGGTALANYSYNIYYEEPPTP